MKHLSFLYAATIFLSASLLFTVQPMIGKYLLPLLGGGPSVWNTAMLFFQILLLGGYAYAFFMARYVPSRAQVLVHGGLLLLAALSLPLYLPPDTDPSGHDPMLWQLKTMLLMAAAPFFVLSSTAPLLQQWFSRSQHPLAHNPYPLYVASNIGSMLALLSYPIIIEPLLTLHNQGLYWSYGYGLLALAIIITGLSTRFTQPAAQTSEATPDTGDEVITWKRRCTWLLLAFVPSSLMLGVTTYITTDIITVPLIWVIPLALYLLSFIIAFAHKPFFSLGVTRIIQSIVALMMMFIITVDGILGTWNQVIIHLAFMFFTALLCHQELAALKPKAKHLTEFYLLMSAGGALGGVFNSLLAPLLFVMPYEYMLIIILSVFCRYIAEASADSTKPLREKIRTFFKDFDIRKDWQLPVLIILAISSGIFLNKYLNFIASFGLPILCAKYITTRWRFATLFTLVLIAHPLISWDALKDHVTIARNYYGVILVHDKLDVRFMTHGVTNHGGQILTADKKFEPFGYYGTGSGVNDAFKTSRLADTTTPQRIAILGLGTGSTACFYNQSNRQFDYFEIDPNVIRIASDPRYFTYLSDCGVNYKMHQGDGRLELAKQPDGIYDVINIDVFTSDNIPMHIITLEAMREYTKKLKPDGVIIIHISNRFFMLGPEMAALATGLGYDHLYKFNMRKSEADEKKTAAVNHPNIYAVITNNQSVLTELKAMDKAWETLELPEGFKPWTDDYANALRSFRR